MFELRPSPTPGFATAGPRAALAPPPDDETPRTSPADPAWLPPVFSVDVRPDRERIFVCPVGELDVATCPELERDVQDLLERGFAEIVVDLRKTTYADSSGIRTILQCMEGARRAGARCRVVAGHKSVMRAFELCGVRERLDLLEPRLGSS